MGIWICTASDSEIGTYIQGAKLATCFSYSLLFWSNLFNYFLYHQYLGSFKYIDSILEDMTKIMKE